MPTAKAPTRSLPDLVGQPVRIHFNLHKGGYTITDPRAGRVSGWVTTATLTGVRFRVKPGTLAKIREDGRRAVCAYATGILTSYGDTAPDTAGMAKVTFSPWRPADTFTLADGTTPVTEADAVVFAAASRKQGYGWLPS